MKATNGHINETPRPETETTESRSVTRSITSIIGVRACFRFYLGS
jgi:hypothetical protein